MEKVAKEADALVVGPSELGFSAVGGEDDKGKEGGEAADAAATVGKVKMTMWIMTSTEAQGCEAGFGRSEPNDHPQLITPTEGRDWGSYLASFGFSLPDLGLWKKMIPVVLGMFMFLGSTIALKNMGLL